MPVWQTIVIYVVIPLAIALFLASLTLPGGRKRPRWKSGQAWPHEAIWYEPHPEAVGEHGGGHGDDHADGQAALTAGHAPAAVLDAGPSAGATAAGSGEADAHPIAGGPLGGARGTW